MTIPNSIYLSLSADGWMASFCGPHARKIIEAFGSATIPTAYTAATPAAVVRDEIAKRNPSCHVYAKAVWER